MCSAASTDFTTFWICHNCTIHSNKFVSWVPKIIPISQDQKHCKNEDDEKEACRSTSTVSTRKRFLSESDEDENVKVKMEEDLTSPAISSQKKKKTIVIDSDDDDQNDFVLWWRFLSQTFIRSHPSALMLCYVITFLCWSSIRMIFKLETTFRRYGSVTLRNKMKPFFWLIEPVTSIL